MFQSAHYPIARVTMVTSSTPAIVRCPPSQWSPLINTPSTLHPFSSPPRFVSFISPLASKSSVELYSLGGSFATFYRFFTAESRVESFVTKYCVNVTKPFNISQISAVQSCDDLLLQRGSRPSPLSPGCFARNSRSPSLSSFVTICPVRTCRDMCAASPRLHQTTNDLPHTETWVR